MIKAKVKNINKGIENTLKCRTRTVEVRHLLSMYSVAISRQSRAMAAEALINTDGTVSEMIVEIMLSSNLRLR
jgi:hypothetical protein